MTKTIIIGMGNPLLTDDTVGLLALDAVQQKLAPLYPDVHFTKCYAGGLDLLVELVGFSCAIIIDSIQTGARRTGFCHVLSSADIGNLAHARLVGTHGLNLPTVLHIGKKFGYNMPEDVRIFAIEGSEFEQFSPEPSPAVFKSIPYVADKIASVLSTWAKREMEVAPVPA